MPSTDDPPKLLDTLGQVRLRIGRTEEAIEVLNEAIKRKDDPAFRIHLAHCYLTKKDLTNAKEQWSRIRRIELADAELTLQDQELLKSIALQLGEGVN